MSRYFSKSVVKFVGERIKLDKSLLLSSGDLKRESIGIKWQTLLTGTYNGKKGSDTPFFEIKSRDLNAVNCLIGGGESRVLSPEEIRAETAEKINNLIIVYYRRDGDYIVCVGIGIHCGVDKNEVKNPFSTVFPLSSDKRQVKLNRRHFFEYYRFNRVFGEGYQAKIKKGK